MPHPLSANPNKYNQPANYTGLIPWPIYLALQNKFAQYLYESDRDWVRRISASIMKAPDQILAKDLMHFSSNDFKSELLSKVKSKDWGAAAVKRDELMDGLNRVATRQVYSGGDKGVAAKQVGLNPSALAIKGQNAESRAKSLVDKLIASTNVDTPDNGSVFWNGIDARKLVHYIEKWNKASPGMFGQLEATTDVRLVDGQFVWNNSPQGKNLQHYFAGVSENLGNKARGHMTAAVLWGFRNTSILTYAELPRILYGMSEALEKGQKPAVTDISIVIIDAIGSNGNVNIVNNADILNLPIWQPAAGTPGYSKHECALTGTKLSNFKNIQGKWTGKPTVPNSQALRDYLKSRPRHPSAAAVRIVEDARNLVRDSNKF